MKKEMHFQRALKIAGIVIICIIFSFVLAQFMLTGLVASNMLFALSAGKSVTGIITDKIEVRGTYRLIIDIDAYDTLDYPCGVDIFSLYNVGDTVTFGVNVIVT